MIKFLVQKRQYIYNTAFIILILTFIFVGCSSSTTSVNTERVDPVAAPDVGYTGYSDCTAEVTFTTFKGFNLATHMLSESDIVEDIAEVKNLGANLVGVEIIFMFEGTSIEANMGETSRDPGRYLSLMITEAHNQGLLVEIRPFPVIQATGEGTAEDFDELLENYKSFIEYWAAFAEEYNVYHFSVCIEIDLLHQLFYGDFSFEENLGEFARGLLPNVRAHYSGKVGVSLAPQNAAVEYDLTGFDYFGTSINLSDPLDYTDFTDSMTSQVANLQSVIDQGSFEAFIVEETDIVVLTEDETDAFGNPVTAQSRAEYFANLFTTLASSMDGFYVNGLADDATWDLAKPVIQASFEAM